MAEPGADLDPPGDTPPTRRGGNTRPGREIDGPGAIEKEIDSRTKLVIGGIAAFVAIALTVVLAATSGGDSERSATELPSQSTSESTAAVVGTIDVFDRPNARRLGQFTTDRTWEEVVGRWGVRGGAAYVVSSDEFRNHATVGLGQGDGAVQVRIDQMTAGAGIVFRFRGPASYWAVLAAPDANTWNLIRVEDTVAEFMGNTGIAPVADGTVVAARFDGQRIDVIVDGTVRLTAESDFLASEGRVGMTVRGEDATEARFDNFVAALPGNRPLFIGSAGVPTTTGG